MRILIDLQGAQTASRYRGIGRYSMSLALAIARNRGKHDIWLALNGAFPETVPEIRSAFRELIPSEQIRVFKPPLPVAEQYPGIKWRTRSAELIREYFLAQLQPDVVLVTSMIEGYTDDAVTSVGTFFPGGKTAAVHYDLIPLSNPEEYLCHSSYRDFFFRKLDHLRNSALLLAISESTMKEALASPELGQKQVVNISAAADPRFMPLPISEQQKSGLLDKYGIKKNLVLYVPGGFDHRKNFGRLFAAFAGLPKKQRREHQLVIVGKTKKINRDHLCHIQKKAGLKNGELILAGYVPDDELVMLYNLAVLSVCPSTHEGFGLPALEAMACGAPVIASNTSSFPEVIGSQDALFDPGSARSITGCMERFLEDEPLRARLRDRGLEQAKKFSWDVSAGTALKALEKLHAEHYPENKPSLRPANNQAGEWVGSPGSQDEYLPANRETLLHGISRIPGIPPEEEPLRQLSRAIAAAVPPETTQKQLLVDISSINKEDIKTGIQRVVRAQLLELLLNPPDGFRVEPVHLNDQDGQWHYRYARSFMCTLLGARKLNLTDEPADISRGDILYIPDFPFLLLLQASSEGIYQELSAQGVFISTVVHDLLPVLRPEFFTDNIDRFHAEWLEVVTGISNQVICPSASVAAELESWLEHNYPERLNDLRIEHVHHGADIEASVPTRGLPEGSRDLLETMTSAPTFLMVGTIEPRKGYLQAIASFDLLWREGEEANLVIIGRESWTHLPDSQRRTVPEIIRSIRTQENLGKRIFWMEDASDELLLQAYDSASCLIFASEGEGFGLPLIEAARHGLPIIARDIPVFREVAGEHAFYFTGLQAEDLAGAVREWLILFRGGEHPPSRGIPWISWKENVKQLKRLLIQDSRLKIQDS